MQIGVKKPSSVSELGWGHATVLSFFLLFLPTALENWAVLVTAHNPTAVSGLLQSLFSREATTEGYHTLVEGPKPIHTYIQVQPMGVDGKGIRGDLGHQNGILATQLSPYSAHL